MAFHVKDVIDYLNCAETLQTVIPNRSIEELANAFEAYFMDGCNWEQDLVYSNKQRDEFIKSLMTYFIAEETSDTRAGAETALSLGMELLPNDVDPVFPAGGLLG